MRITFALPGLAGLSGGLRVAAQYARHLHDAGHEVTLAVRYGGHIPGLREKIRQFLGLYPPYEPLPEQRGFFSGLDVPIIHLDTYRPVRAGRLPDADLLVSTWWTTTEWAGRLPARKGRHVHFIQGYEDFHPETHSRVMAVYAQKNSKIVVASWLREMMRERHGQDSTVVLNGVDTGAFIGPERRMNAEPRVGFLYNPHFCKNVGLAIEVARKLHEKMGIGALSFGTRPRPQALPDWIDYEQSPSQDRIAALYAGCDFWLFPSRSEGFGLPILEAMACRTPVIATKAGAAPDVIDGLNGRIVPDDADSFVAAIAEILQQGEGAWKVASDAALATARNHDLARAAGRFEEALKMAAQGGQSGYGGA